MCTGRIDLAHVLRAFAGGADGVSVAGCHLNECNYTTHGNFHALSMVHLGKKLIEHAGLNPERLRMDLVSSGEGNRFAEIMNDFGATIRGLGPLGSREEVEHDELDARLQSLAHLVPYIKRVKFEKLTTRFDAVEEYRDLFTSEEIEEMVRDAPSYYIDPEKCRACMTCFKQCPVDAIDGGRNRTHVIDQGLCIKCGTCAEVCPSRYSAVDVLTGVPVPPPLPEEQRTIVRKKKEESLEGSVAD